MTLSPNTRSKASKNVSVLALDVFGLLVAFRILNALLLQTFFQPDEYFQSLEPAWQIAFGHDSGAWITWEWRERLRSSLHPLLFAAVFRACILPAQILGLSPQVQAAGLLAGPKVIQGLLAASTDYITWRLSKNIFGTNSAAGRVTLFLTVLSPWNWFCSTRTLSNCIETLLTSAALLHWPFGAFSEPENLLRVKQLRYALTFAALATILRPTNVIIWLITALVTLSSAWSAKRNIAHTAGIFVRESLICGPSVIALSLAADRLYYQQWTFPPLRFIHFNVVQALAVFYGANRTDYYFTEGLPLLLTTTLPFASVGILEALQGTSITANSRNIATSTSTVTLRSFAICALAMVVTLSLISHKEVRFIYPLLPMLLVLASSPFARFFSPFPRPRQTYKTFLLLAMVVAHVGFATYISLVHQRGVIDVTRYLRTEYETRYLGPGNSQIFQAVAANTTIGFLMPCHSTPWRNHLVYPGIHAWALTCEPPLNIPIAERSTYLDEADQFYADPAAWLSLHMESTKTIRKPGGAVREQVEEGPRGADQRRVWPAYLAFFEQLEPLMQRELGGTQYRECWRGFNTHFHDDWRRKGDVIVWCQNP